MRHLGDAAVVINEKTNNACDLYCYLILPLEYKLPVFPVQYETFRVGAAPVEVRGRFEIIIKELKKLNIHVLFKAVDGKTTMNTWFTEIFHHFFTGPIRVQSGHLVNFEIMLMH